MSDLEETAGLRYRDALSRHGMRDLQPACRKLLVRLREADAAAYEEAVTRYRERLLPRVASGEADPVAAWVRYGAWLCGRLGEGRCVAVDGSGRAEAVEGDPPPGRLVLFIPADDGERAIPIAMPEEPSEPQRTTVDLLCG